MKKIVVLMLVVISATAVSAQSIKAKRRALEVFADSINVVSKIDTTKKAYYGEAKDFFLKAVQPDAVVKLKERVYLLYKDFNVKIDLDKDTYIAYLQTVIRFNSSHDTAFQPSSNTGWNDGGNPPQRNPAPSAW